MNEKKQPPLDDEEFMVYDFDYAGKRIKLDIKPKELQNYLNPERVLIIIRRDLHRIYIWKGSESPGRKMIISSRVAFDIWRDLDQKDRDYKIISINQPKILFPTYDYYNDGKSWGSSPNFPQRPDRRKRVEYSLRITTGKINCQYCGKDLTKEEQLTHFCQNKPEKDNS